MNTAVMMEQVAEASPRLKAGAHLFPYILPLSFGAEGALTVRLLVTGVNEQWKEQASLIGRLG